MGDLDLFVKVTEAERKKSLSSRHLHIYNLYCFHITASDPHDESQGPV